MATYPVQAEDWDAKDGKRIFVLKGSSVSSGITLEYRCVTKTAYQLPRLNGYFAAQYDTPYIDLAPSAFLRRLDIKGSVW